MKKTVPASPLSPELIGSEPGPGPNQRTEPEPSEWTDATEIPVACDGLSAPSGLRFLPLDTHIHLSLRCFPFITLHYQVMSRSSSFCYIYANFSDTSAGTDGRGEVV